MIKILAQGLFLLAFFSVTHNTYAQKHFSIGILGQLEKSRNTDIRLTGGVSLSKKINRYMEVETEIIYRTAPDNSLTFFVPLPPNNAAMIRYNLMHKFLTIPLMVAYNSKIINFHAGPAADVFLGWDNRGYMSDPLTPAIPLSSDYFDKRLLWGAKFKIGKTIKISGTIYLEPYLFYNPVFTKYSFVSGYHSYSRQFMGFTVPIKFKLLKQATPG